MSGLTLFAARAAYVTPSVAGGPGDGTAGDDTLTGTDGDDTLAALAGNDVLHGLGGNDLLMGGAGSDTLDGGDGSDTASYADAAKAVRVSLALTGAQNTGGSGMDTLTAIEWLTGSKFNDTLTGDAGDNYLRGGAGNDYLIGGMGNDIIDGGGGHLDRVSYSDVTIPVGGVGVRVNLSLTGYQDTNSAGMDELIGIELLAGSRFDDYLTGTSGDDTLRGSGGDDVLAGGGGNDIFDGGAEADLVTFAKSPVAVHVDLSIIGLQDTGDGIDTFLSIEEIQGSAHNDTLIGSSLTDSIGGGVGNDVLDGGLGSDFLSGDGGRNKFLFTTALGSSNVDQINDFVHGQDTIVMDHAIFSGLPIGALSSNSFRQGASAQDADDRIIYNSSTGEISFDNDGTGSNPAVLFDTVTGGLTLSAKDFIVS